jgi:hypothetical protein
MSCKEQYRKVLRAGEVKWDASGQLKQSVIMKTRHEAGFTHVRMVQGPASPLHRRFPKFQSGDNPLPSPYVGRLGAHRHFNLKAWVGSGNLWEPRTDKVD